MPAGNRAASPCPISSDDSADDNAGKPGTTSTMRKLVAGQLEGWRAELPASGVAGSDPVVPTTTTRFSDAGWNTAPANFLPHFRLIL